MMRKTVRATAMAIIIFLLALSGCERNIHNIINGESCVRGEITEVNKNYIMINVSEDDKLYKSYSEITVSLDAERKDSMENFSVGDEVAVYYDGSIQETFPSRINNVYSIIHIDDTE